MNGNYIAVAAVTVIVTTMLICSADIEVKKDYAKAGYIVIDKIAYRLVPANP